MDEKDRRLYLKRFRRPHLENVHRQALSKTVNATARKVVYCPYCSATNGVVKKAGALKIIHDKFRAKKTADELEKWKLSFSAAVESQKELAIYINKAVHEDLNPLKVLDLFRRISDEVIGVLFILAMTLKKYIFFFNFPMRLGLRIAWVTTQLGSSGRIHLAIFICSSGMYTTFCRTGRSIERGRFDCQAYRDRVYQCTD